MSTLVDRYPVFVRPTQASPRNEESGFCPHSLVPLELVTPVRTCPLPQEQRFEAAAAWRPFFTLQARVSSCQHHGHVFWILGGARQGLRSWGLDTVVVLSHTPRPAQSCPFPARTHRPPAKSLEVCVAVRTTFPGNPPLLLTALPLPLHPFPPAPQHPIFGPK